MVSCILSSVSPFPQCLSWQCLTVLVVSTVCAVSHCLHGLSPSPHTNWTSDSVSSIMGITLNFNLNCPQFVIAGLSLPVYCRWTVNPSFRFQDHMVIRALAILSDLFNCVCMKLNSSGPPPFSSRVHTYINRPI